MRNLEATIEPAETGPETKTIVVGAHYDSVRRRTGANDNGSGTAAVLELARLLKDLRPRPHAPAAGAVRERGAALFPDRGHGQLPLRRAAGRSATNPSRR